MTANNKKKTNRSQSKRHSNKASHDVTAPPALIDFMLQGWKPAKGKLPSKVKGATRFAERRSRLCAAFSNEALVIPTGNEKVRANDTNYRFRPNTAFFYLTGNAEADCVLVLLPKGRGKHEHVMFVEPNPGRSDPTFFTDRHKGELWVGPRLGVPESEYRFQIDRCMPLEQLGDMLKKIQSNTKQGYRVLRGVDSSVDKVCRHQVKKDRVFQSFLSEMRLEKDAGELAALRRACSVTRRGFEDVIACLPTAKTEREVEAAFCRRARVDGNDVGYNVIAAAGANACILHWNDNDGPLRKSDLLLLDAGIETEDLYTADVTRTVPIGGCFSKPQREVYDLVREGQKAALAAIKPGAAFMAPHWAAMRVLAEGLVRLGILKMSVEEAMAPQNQFYKRYTLHGVSHMLGMDVHDCSDASPELYRNGTIEPGMVLTVEPGLYFQKDDLTVARRYRGIGVRIEDDVVVTKRGHKILSDVPRDADDVERWMADVWAKPKGKAHRKRVA